MVFLILQRYADQIDRKRLAQSEREGSVEVKKKRAKKKRQKKNKGVDRYEPGGGDGVYIIILFTNILRTDD